ncbi:MAG: sulfatase-like hydrolase/transferase [Chitinophagaceae bacterium]|nr:sulfatase-like hydrolase/transferase [Chitinophagaceae bacterium]
MKKLTVFSLLLIAYWFAVFFINRFFFILYQLPVDLKINNSLEIFRAFYKGQALDLSVAAMFTLPAVLLAIAFFVTNKPVLAKTLQVLMLCFLMMYVAVGLADAGLYKEWNAKINMQALSHFKNPAEVYKTVSSHLIILFIILLAALTAPFHFFYRKKIHRLLTTDQETSWKKKIFPALLFFLISSGAGIIAVRGGVGDVAINQSFAYFSNETLANDMAVNPFYTLLQDIDINSKLPDTSIYKISTNEEAQRQVAADYRVAEDSTIRILKSNRPNIVYIFLESWSADNVGALGGLEGCTPEFDKLCAEGLLFTKAYSDAYVSDQGIVTGLSAYPAAHRMAIANQPGKIAQLPCISEELISLGYRTSFLYGGDLMFGNLRGYLLEKKFQQLKEANDLKQYPTGKLGVHDEFTFKELLTTLNTSTAPFFQGFFTMSTHMPYDFAAESDWHSSATDVEKQYTESVHYSDRQLGFFFDEAKKQSWYDHTLFVLVSDHSHNSIKQWDGKSAMRQQIPLLFAGGALMEEWRGKKWNKIVSQLDIVATLLHQMGIDSKKYPWSRNMLNPFTPSAAYYVFYGGAGYVNDRGYVGADYYNNDFVSSNLEDSLMINEYKIRALSFQQLVFENLRWRK